MKSLRPTLALLIASLGSCLATIPSALAQEKLVAGDLGTVTTPDKSQLLFTIVTNKGFVRFAAERSWKVLSIKSKPPVAVAVFQLDNPADGGTSESTNVAVTLATPGAAPADKAIEDIGKKLGAGDVQATTKGGWSIFSQVGTESETPYAVLDAKTTIADVVAGVRLAWPQLPNNPPDYDSTMRAAFDRLLQSFEGGTGPYAPKPGEVMRRPE